MERLQSALHPSNPAEAVLNGLNYLAHGREKKIIHGSTVATNAILERNGAKTALITNKGFEDIIEIGRQNRTRLYDLCFRKEPHIISSDLRFGLPGRILQTGEELIPLDIQKTEAVGERLKDRDVESVAVCLLFSYVNPCHEQKVRQLLEPLGLQLSPVSYTHLRAHET